MGKTKERGRYFSISIPIDFVNEVRDIVLSDPKYKSVAEYTKEALREKMDQDLYKEFGTLSGKTPVDIKLEELEKKIDLILKEFKKKK